MTYSDDEVRSFLAEKRRQIAGRALMTYPQPAADEEAGVAVWTRLLHVLAAPVLMRHPHVPLTLELSRAIGPRLSYLAARLRSPLPLVRLSPRLLDRP